MISEIKKFTDKEGRGVTMYVPVSGTEKDEQSELAEPKPYFEGTVGIPTQMGVQALNFPFPEDYTLEKCFENFDKVAQEEVPKIIHEAQKKHQEENLIVTPGQAAQQGGTIQFPHK